MNCIDKELRGDASFFLILAEPEKPKPRNHNDRWIRVAQFRRVVCGPVVVILFVGGAIFRDFAANASLERLNIFFVRIPRQEPWTDASRKKVIGTTRPKCANFLRPVQPAK